MLRGVLISQFISDREAKDTAEILASKLPAAFARRYYSIRSSISVYLLLQVSDLGFLSECKCKSVTADSASTF